jgi:ABC-2 type transport system permease protein
MDCLAEKESAISTINALTASRATGDRGASFQLFADLLRVLGADLRRSWPWLAVLSILMPITLTWFLSLVLGLTDPATLRFYLAGSLVLSTALGPMSYVLQRLAWSREVREFDYFATLPVPKLLVVLVLFVLGFVSSLPGAVAVLAAGVYGLGVAVDFNPLIPLVLALSSLTLCGVGALLGVWVKDGPTSSVVNQVMVVVVTFLAPVLIPAERLPTPMQWISHLLPPTYAASAVRSVLAGDVGPRLWLDIAILFAMAVGALLVVQRKLEWRGADD